VELLEEQEITTEAAEASGASDGGRDAADAGYEHQRNELEF